MLDLKDKIVEFLSDGQPAFGLVTTRAVSKLQLTDANGRNRSLPLRNILIVHPVQSTLAEFNSTLQPLQAEIESLVEEVDTELLWEATRTISGPLESSFLAREYFGSEDSKSCSAVLRAAMTDTVHFRQKGTEIYARPPAQVEQQIHQREVEKQRAERWDSISGWLNRALIDSEMTETEGEFAELLEAAQKFLRSPRAEPPDFLTEAEPEIWKRTPLLRELTPREVAFQLLVCAGLLPKDADPLLVIAGVDPSFSPEAEAAAAALEPYPGEATRLDLQHLEALAVDDEGTLEVDDALTLEITPSGWRAGIHIADAAYFVAPQGDLFEEACSRVSSLYLPHRLLTMLPARVSCDLASLQEKQLRPCISTFVEVDAAGEIQDFRICSSQLRVSKRLTYDQVDRLLEEESDPTLSWFSWFAGHLKEVRREAGALNFKTPEFKVRVDDQEKVEIVPLDPDSPSRTLISEMMILANSLAARFAREHEVQLIYRSQKPPKKEVKIPQEYDPIALREVFRALERSLYGLEPQPHTGLGVEAYAQTTSPLRRLVDLISQLQLSTFLRGEDPPFSREQLESRIRGVGEVERNLRAVERRAVSYYVLKHLWEELRSEKFQGIVLGPADRGFQIELVHYPLRARLLGGKARHAPGQVLSVEIVEVDLDKLSLVVR